MIRLDVSGCDGGVYHANWPHFKSQFDAIPVRCQPSRVQRCPPPVTSLAERRLSKGPLPTPLCPIAPILFYIVICLSRYPALSIDGYLGLFALHLPLRYHAVWRPCGLPLAIGDVGSFLGLPRDDSDHASISHPAPVYNRAHIYRFASSLNCPILE